jgi:hypothetical protein
VVLEGTRSGARMTTKPANLRIAVNLWPETGQALGLSRNATYSAAKKGQIPTIYFGRLRKVPLWFYRQLCEGTPKTQADD